MDKREAEPGGLSKRDSFVHLHLHTEYSMLDGASRIGDVVAAVASDGQPAVGITDHGNMYGALPMYTAARENMQRIPTRLTVLVLPALLGPRRTEVPRSASPVPAGHHA